MPNAHLEALAAEIQQDEALMREFRQIVQEDAFVARAVEVARARGYDDVTEDDVRAYLQEARAQRLSEAELDEAVGGQFDCHSAY